MQVYAATGKVIAIRKPSFKTEKAVLEVTVNVRSGQKKRDGDEYAPSLLFSILVWDKTAEYLEPKLEVGNRVSFMGQLGDVNVYEGKNGLTANLTLHQVHSFNIEEDMVYEENASAAKATKAPAASSRKASAAPAIPDWNALEDDEVLF